MKKHGWYDSIWDVSHIRNGKVIWQESKHNALVDEGERSMLLAYYRGTEVPTEFYLRLAYDTILETDALVNISNEPVGYGYAPILVEKSAVGFPTLELDAGDYRLTSKEVEYAAVGGDIGPVNALYLATTLNNTGKLVAFVALSMERTILDGDSMRAKMRIKLK